MDFWELLKVLTRRWQVVVPIVVVSLVAAMQLSSRVEPTYQAAGSVILMPPRDRSQAESNAFLSAGLATAAEAIAIGSQDQRTRNTVEDAGGASGYTVTSLRRSPIINIAAEGETREQSIETVGLLVDVLDRQLVERQDAVAAPPESRITLQNLSPELAAAPVYKGAQRVKILVVGMGLVLAALAALGLEGLAVLRLRRSGVLVATNWNRLPLQERSQLLTARLQLLEEREQVLRERERLLGGSETGRWAAVEPGGGTVLTNRPTSQPSATDVTRPVMQADVDSPSAYHEHWDDTGDDVDQSSIGGYGRSTAVPHLPDPSDHAQRSRATTPDGLLPEPRSGSRASRSRQGKRGRH